MARSSSFGNGGLVHAMGEDAFGILFHNIQPAELDELERLIDEYEEGDGQDYA